MGSGVINWKLIFIMLVLGGLSFLLIVNLESITNGIFIWFDYYDKAHTPYYDFLHGLIVLIVLTLIVMFFSSKRFLKIWGYKVFVTMILMMIYETYYSLDAYMYFGKAVIYQNLTWHNQTGTHFIIYFNHFLSYAIGESYYAMKLVSSFIGFLGLVFIYKSYEYIMENSGKIINPKFIYFFFLFPTVIFWSSVLGKDPLNLFFIGLFVYAFVHIIDEFKISYLLMILLSIWLVGYIRSWWSIIMISSMFFYFLKINSIRSFLLFSLVLPIFLIAAQQFLQTEGITSMDALFLKMNETSKNLSYGGSSVGVHIISGFGDYILWFIPNLFTSLFRPMPWDIRNAFTLIAAIENVVLFYLFYKYIFKNWKEIYSNKYLKFLILLIFSWSLLYVIISPTNLGMAARFKLQVLPMMLVLIGISNIKTEKNSI